MSEEHMPDRRAWHVGKEVPLALLSALLLQTGGWVWWAASVSADIRVLKDQVTTVATNQFTSVEARGLIALNAANNEAHDRRVSALEARVRDLENSLYQPRMPR